MFFSPILGPSISQAARRARVALLDLHNPNEELTDYEKAHEKDHNYEKDRIPSYRPIDEIERLEIWFHEHDVLSGKLDHKLRQAPDLRDRVLSLLSELSDLGEQQNDKASPVSEKVDDDDDDESTLSTPSAPQVFIRADENSAVPDSRSSADLDEEVLRLSQLKVKDDQSVGALSLSLDTDATLPDSLPDSPLACVHDVVTLLLELGPTLLDPAPRKRVKQPAQAEMAKYDVNHVKEKFPNAPESLIERLGQANWELRQQLSAFQSENKGKRSQAQDPDTDQPYLPDSESPSEGSVDAGSNPDPPLDTVGLSKDDALEEEMSKPPSRSLTASTSTGSNFEFSHKESDSSSATDSLLDTQDDKEIGKFGTRYKIPLPPNSLDGESFICPLCSFLVSGMSLASEWKKHVFEDLKPYICTYTDCMLPTKTYGNRELWWEHENERHRAKRTWVCKPCEKGQITKSGARRIETGVKKHVADHLEQLAFFVASSAGKMLPNENEPDFQDDSDSDDGLNSRERSIASKDTRLSEVEIQMAKVNSFIQEQQRAGAGVKSSISISPLEQQQLLRSAERYHEEVGQPSATQLAPPVYPIMIITHPPNEHFYSRQELLVESEKVLRTPGSICIFHGVSGVGKTQTAVEYIYSRRERYDVIIWLQADTPPGLTDSYLEMAIALGLTESTEDPNRVIDEGKKWMEETGRRWLLVFDNARRWTEISRYMPPLSRCPRGSILITTQADKLLHWTENVTQMHLRPLDQQNGADMLLSYLDRDPRNDPEKHLAREISAFIGGLPVAIAHIAGFVSFSNYSLKELIQTFQQWRRRSGAATDDADDLPASFREASFSYDLALTMVWEVTLRELTEDARNVLNVFAYLNNASVPQNMLWGIHEDPSLEFLDAREELRNQRVRDSLVKRRLLAVEADSSFSIHRSLQRGLRQKLSRDRRKQQTVFNQAVALVREVFPKSNPLQQPTPEKWSERQKLLPHLYALHDVYCESKPHIKGSIDFAQLLLDAGMDQFEQGIIHEGLQLLITAEAVIESSFLEDHQLMTANIHTLIGVMYDETGIENRQECLARRKSALDIRRNKFESLKTISRQEEILLYNSWMDYAFSLLHYHRYVEAEPIIENCLTKYQEWGTETEIPFEYAKYYGNISFVRMYQGRFNEAVRLATHGVDLMRQTGYVLFTTRLNFELACILLQSGDSDQALHLHQEIYAQRVDSVGATNELTLHSIYAIGAIYELKSNFHEAESWFRKIIDQPSSRFSWSTEAWSRAQFHLYKVLLAQGRSEDVETADTNREKSLRLLHRLLPLDMPPELEGVIDEAIFFDHMLPIDYRFTGRGLLQRFVRRVK